MNEGIRPSTPVHWYARVLPKVLPAVLVCSLLLSSAAVAEGQRQDETWDAQQMLQQKTFITPPDLVAEVVLAPRYLNVTLSAVSPDKIWFVHEISDGPITMDVFSKPFDELGGQFIDFRANRSRTLTIRNNAGLETISASDGSKVRIEVPDEARVSNATWSPDGSRLAFYVHLDDATHIYVADPTTGRSRQITRRPVLATLVTTFEWTSDGEAIATVLLPGSRSPRPVESTVPTGPQVKITEEGENLLRTYASLMATPHDEALLEWHAIGQLAVIDVGSRNVEEIGRPAMIRSFDFSPDGQYARVTRVQQPFSYIVPVNNFARVEEVWDLEGTALAQLDETPMNVGIQDPTRQQRPGQFGEEEPEGRREIAWRSDGQGLTFLEREPVPEGEEDAGATRRRGRRGAEAARPDRVMQWKPPFGDADLSAIYESDSPMTSHRYSPDMSTLFINEREDDNARRDDNVRVREYAVFLDDPETVHTLADYGAEDFYANPGILVMTGGAVPTANRRRFRPGENSGGGGTVQVSSDGEHVFFYGTQHDEDPLAVAPIGFIDRVSILDVDARRFVVSRESPESVAQSYLWEDGDVRQLTQNIDYTPDLTAAPRQRFTVERPDGFEFRVNVTLPPGYRAGTRLPAMFWFYPREYEDQESYDEGARTYDKNAFPNFGTRSMEYLVRLGYAVVEPDAPIVGKPGQMNNNYEHDLRNNLAAVIDELDRREIIDRQRLGIGGHSYGAFSTANAMVHTPFFKAGIAGDGNYNRTLTPLTFQSERRLLWDAKDVYLGMSPFLQANNLTGALLMYHGLHDQNVGTSPIHSPRLFHALNGLGKDAAMYLYPFEDHGPETKETLLDLWGRWAAWLDVYLKDPELVFE